MESLQRLAPLPNTPESTPESQTGTIADTPEAELEPVKAHELTGEGTTNAMDPTTSDGFTEGDEGDCEIDYEELEEMYRGVPTCRDDWREGIPHLWHLNTTQYQAHPTPYWMSLG